MAIYHLSMKAISRSAGRSSTGAAAYRAGCSITDTRTGEVHDYRRKGGVESADLVLPDGVAAMDRAGFWNGVEHHHKRGDALVAREFEVALPAELSADERRRLAVDFAREVANHYGVATDVCIHKPGKEGDNRNHHAHILIAACSISKNGFGKKVATLDPIHCQRHKVPNPADLWRERWAELTNERLQQNQIDAKVDHRSLKDQGVERHPTKHLGPKATAVERRTGKKSDKRISHARKAMAVKIEKLHQVQGQRDLQEAEGLARELEIAKAWHAAWIERGERRRAGEPNRIIALEEATTKDGRKLYKWGGAGPSAGKVAVIQKGNHLSAAGKFSKPKVAAMAQIVQANGWPKVTITGSQEFKLLAMTELLKRGIEVSNPELQTQVEAWKFAQVHAEAQKKMQAQRDRQPAPAPHKLGPIMPKPAPQSEKAATVDDRAEAYARLVKAVSEQGTFKPVEDGKMYIGPILGISECGRFATQSLGRGVVTIHDLSKLEGMYQIGQSVHLTYHAGTARDKHQQAGQEQGRSSRG